MLKFSKEPFKTHDIGDVTVITFLDKRIHDDQQIQRIKNELNSLVDEHAKKKILLNFTGVEYTKEWFGMLLNFHKKVFAIGGKLAMYCMCNDVFEDFEMMRLDSIFIIVPDKQTALLYMMQGEADEPIFLDQW